MFSCHTKSNGSCRELPGTFSLMDILRSQLLWIENRCYRVNSFTNTNSQAQPATNEYIEEDMYASENDCEEEYDIEEIGPNRYKTSFHVPSAFYGRIIGTKAATKKRIEGETKTEIIIPRMGLNDDIKIMGTTRDSVSASRRRVELIVAGCRQKQRPTHFLCVKVSNETVRNNFIKFKKEIIEGQPIRGLTEKMFTKLPRLHLTIAMFYLMDDVDRAKARDLLDKFVQEIINPAIEKHKKFVVKLRGLEIMNDDTSAVRVLYAKVESEILQDIANQIFKRVLDSGLGKREFDRDTVKLHMTLINARYASEDDDDDVQSKSKATNYKFDARSILENYSDFEFGSFDVSDFHLAILETEDTDGFYKCSAHVTF